MKRVVSVLVYHFNQHSFGCAFSLPPPLNFAKTHTRLGRGRLEVALRDLIPPLGVHPVCRGGLPGFGAVPGRRPARGCAGPGLRGRAAVCPGEGVRRAVAVPGAVWSGFSPGAAQILFLKGPSRMY